MGISERKEREKLQMRQLVLAAATEMFIQEGYDRTSIRNIAEKIEYSPATIYLYFKDKTEILEAIMEQGFGMLNQEFSKVIHLSDPMERLKGLADCYLHFAHDFPEYYDLMFIMKTPVENVVEEDDWDCGHQAYMTLFQTVQACQETGKLKVQDPHAASLMLWSILHGMVSLHIRKRLIFFPEAQLDAIIHHCASEMVRLVSA